MFSLSLLRSIPRRKYGTLCYVLKGPSLSRKERLAGWLAGERLYLWDVLLLYWWLFGEGEGETGRERGKVRVGLNISLRHRVVKVARVHTVSPRTF